MRSQADMGVSQLANNLCLHCSEQRRLRLRPSSQIQQNRKPIGQEEEQEKEERRGEIFIHLLSLRDEAK